MGGFEWGGEKDMRFWFFEVGYELVDLFTEDSER